MKLDSLDGAASPGTVYVPLSQLSFGPLEEWRPFPMQLAVRTAVPPDKLASL